MNLGNTLKAFILEDDIALSTLLESVLTSNGYAVSAAPKSLTSALELVPEVHPDFYIVDIDLGVGPNGLDFAIALRRFNPKAAILFFSSHRNLKLLRIPADLESSCVFVPKDSLTHFTILEAGIKRALEIQSLEIAPRISNIPAPSEVSSMKLTPNDFALLELITQGHSNKEIARRKSISVKSCENSIARLSKKLGITHVEEANQRVCLANRYFEITGKKAASA